MLAKFRHTLQATAVAVALFAASQRPGAISPAPALRPSSIRYWPNGRPRSPRLFSSKVNYQSDRSGGGIAQIKAATVDFGASDKPLEAKDLAEAGLGQFPVVIGGIVPVVNIEGVQPGGIKLSGPVLADIFLGKVLKWNDKAIADLNPGAKLPETLITVVHRLRRFRVRRSSA